MHVNRSGGLKTPVRLARPRETSVGVNRRGGSQEALAEREDLERISTFKFNSAFTKKIGETTED